MGITKLVDVRAPSRGTELIAPFPLLRAPRATPHKEVVSTEFAHVGLASMARIVNWLVHRVEAVMNF